MKKIVKIIVLLFFLIILALGAMVFYVLVTDDTGRDPCYNLNDGYRLVAFSSEDWQLYYYDAGNSESKYKDGVIIVEGNIQKYYSNRTFIIVYEKGKQKYYCIDKRNKKSIFECKTQEKMMNYIKDKYKKINIEMKET
ncbi:hypothetical protein [Anaerostipes sp.]|uniref:hypothetical protein n=1 Tax=Anaerostipes sp. TaxID=1872530 RepID=UPI0025BAF23C|nr:hypothetical protein [Anaerostipes sp.]MBS7006940.1 hypothetical protein [Anaerostipes sp.]